VARRVDRLERDGVVAGYTAQLGPAGREWPTEAFVELFCGNRTSTSDIAATVKGQPEVLAAYTGHRRRRRDGALAPPTPRTWRRSSSGSARTQRRAHAAPRSSDQAAERPPH
jgi:hypothetical protein